MYLPAGWEPRPEQIRLYEEVKSAFEKGARVVFLDAPTGIGKSAIARALFEYYDSGLVVTATKQLQDQYVQDFEMPRLVGRSNFSCSIGRRMTCEQGYYRTSKLNGKKSREYCADCPYEEHKEIALKSRFYVANYASAIWTAMDDYTRDLFVIDEGHRVEAEILNSLTVTISNKWVLELDIEWPESEDDEDELLDWVFLVFDELREYKKSHANAETDRFYASVNSMIYSMEAGSLRWIPTASLNTGEDKDFIVYKPLSLTRKEASYFLNKGNKVLIMSATILDPREMANNLGLYKKEWSYVYSNQAFAPDTRQVRAFEFAPPVTRQFMDEALSWLVEMVGMLMEEHPDQKGLVHTASTRIASHLVANLDDPEDRLLRAWGRFRNEAYRKHLASSESTVLVSPSMAEGVDLKDDLARWIVICKCPYMSLGDKQTAERARIDPKWYQMHAVRQIIQSCGRGTRSEGDSCVTYVLDSKVNDILESNRESVPEWFWDAWELYDG